MKNTEDHDENKVSDFLNLSYSKFGKNLDYRFRKTQTNTNTRSHTPSELDEK
jgi:hypothetical protein